MRALANLGEQVRGQDGEEARVVPEECRPREDPAGLLDLS